jgi:DNA-binding MurR/RpiR family transcriptional regulator
MESYVAALSLLNALLTAIAFKDAKSSLNHLGQLEKIWREKGVYFHEQGG